MPYFWLRPLEIVYQHHNPTVSQQVPNMAEQTQVIPLLSSLQFTHPSFVPLLESHKPLARPSISSQSQLNKLISRLNTVLLAKDDSREKRAACIVAKEMINQDEEGWVLAGWGKGWLGGCLGWIAVGAFIFEWITTNCVAVNVVPYTFDPSLYLSPQHSCSYIFSFPFVRASKCASYHGQAVRLSRKAFAEMFG